MSKLRAMIIDDEPLAHEILLDYLSEVSFIEVTMQAYNAVDAMSYLNQSQVDLLFLDINMPKFSGIEFLKVLNEKPKVIITSAYGQYALESFELDVSDYLLKPYRFERFLKAVNKVHQQIQFQKNPSPSVTDKTENKTIFIKVDKKLVQLDIEHITYLEAYGNYVKVWIHNKMYLTPRTLISFEKELAVNNDNFVRIHKSFIVQKKYIKVIENKSIEMANGEFIPIGKNYQHVLKSFKGN